ncbi:hypothetical protein J6590_037901 [Homalodisca vitripennis]|nr:hypothetical protein J6590_037901 [Homalodisca vitripennis]
MQSINEIILSYFEYIYYLLLGGSLQILGVKSFAILSGFSRCTKRKVNWSYWWREKRRDLARAGAQLCTSVLPRGNFRRFAPQPTLRIVYPSNGVICFQ